MKNDQMTLNGGVYQKRASLPVMIVFLIIIVSEGCKKDAEESSVPDKGTLLSQTERKGGEPALVVHFGESIQSALNQAKAGATIEIEAGVYKENLTVDKPGISLVGKGKVILQNPGEAAIGIVVQDAADGFGLRDLTIRDFKERGAQLTHIDGFTLSGITVINNGEFGLFSEFCRNGLIEHCEGTAHAETAVFVGQSTDVTVSKNKAYANVIGLEVENSSRVVFDKNHAYNNAVGILCLLVPGRMTKASSEIVISQNQVRENNHPNFSKPPEMESVLPSGVGILVVGADHALLQGNQVADNSFVGLAVVSTLIIGALTQLPPDAFADIEPDPDQTLVTGNHLVHNGFSAPAGIPLPPADLLWDGSGEHNCWNKNVFTVSYPATLPLCN